MIFYVEGRQCPDGSSPLPQARGRLLIVNYDAQSWGTTNDVTPFGPNGEGGHSDSIELSSKLAEKSISGASGCCNEKAAGKGTYKVAETANKATSDLPFIQLLICQAD